MIDAIVIEDTRFAEGLGQTGFAKSKTIDMLIGPTVLRSKPLKGGIFGAAELVAWEVAVIRLVTISFVQTNSPRSASKPQ